MLPVVVLVHLVPIKHGACMRGRWTSYTELDIFLCKRLLQSWVADDDFHGVFNSS